MRGSVRELRVISRCLHRRCVQIDLADEICRFTARTRESVRNTRENRKREINEQTPERGHVALDPALMIY